MQHYRIILAIILCIGAFQGVFYGALLFKKEWRGRLSNQVLSLILFLLAYSLINEVLLLFRIGAYDLWYHLTLELNWAFGPLIFLFVKAKSEPQSELKKQDLRLLFPVLVQLAISIFVRSQNFFWDGSRDSLSWLGYWGYVVWMNYPTKYVIASGLVVFYAMKGRGLLSLRITQVSLSSDGRQQLQGLTQALSIVALYFGTFVLVLILDMAWYEAITDEWYYFFTRYYYYPFFIGIAILTYGLAFSGFAHLKNNISLSPRPTPVAPELRDLAEQVTQLATETDFFLQPELRLSDLANRLSIKPYILSKIFSKIFEIRFNDYVNQRRLEGLQRLVRGGKHGHFSLLGMAYEVGFNSKAAFQRAVKKEYDCSPSELLSRLKKGLD